MKIVEIIWVDSCAVADVWEPKNDYDDSLVEEHSVGYLIHKDKEKIIICQSYSDYQYGQVFRIPMGCVKKIKHLNEK